MRLRLRLIASVHGAHFSLDVLLPGWSEGEELLSTVDVCSLDDEAGVAHCGNSAASSRGLAPAIGVICAGVWFRCWSGAGWGVLLLTIHHLS